MMQKEVCTLRLSVSNIGWQAEDDREIYALMKEYGYSGLEIAPTRIFPENPYDRLSEAARWAERLKAGDGFVVPSMQSIWFGRKESIFGTEEERQALADYTKKAIDFAESIGCGNLVFGCPKNRNLPEGAGEGTAISFFKELGDYAAAHKTVIGLEANPPIYHTNFINDTMAAFRLIERVHSDGFKLNLDVGTMIQNGESVDELSGKVQTINHVHISEPGLKPLQKRLLHHALKEVLVGEGYGGFVSIEIGRTGSIKDIEGALAYVGGIFK